METKKSALNDISLMIICLIFIIGSIVASIPLYYGFLAGIILTMYFLTKKGYTLKELTKTVFTAVYEIKNLIIVPNIEAEST